MSDTNADAAHQVLVGWTTDPIGPGLRLNMQTVGSRAELDSEHVREQAVLLTRNQALLLAKHLLDVTGQELPHRPWWRPARSQR